MYRTIFFLLLQRQLILVVAAVVDFAVAELLQNNSFNLMIQLILLFTRSTYHLMLLVFGVAVDSDAVVVASGSSFGNASPVVVEV